MFGANALNSIGLMELFEEEEDDDEEEDVSDDEDEGGVQF